MNREILRKMGSWLEQRKLLLGLVSLLAAPFVFLVVDHLRGSISLTHYVRVLSGRGEKMTAREFLKRPPPGQNGAPEVLAAANDLKAGGVLPKTYPPRMRLTPAGHAVIGFRENYWIEEKVTNQWDQLADDLEANKATLERIRTALAKPVLSCEFDPTLGPKARFPHLTVAKKLTEWFGPRIQLALHEGKTRDALKDVVTEIELPRMLAPDGIVISELVRDAIAAIARGDTWEALQAEGWADDDLAQLQQAWEHQQFASPMARALEGERVFAESSYLLMRQSNQEAAAILFWTDEFPGVEERPHWEQTLRELPGGEATAIFLKKELYCRCWRFAWLDQDQLHYLRYLQELINLARDASIEKSLLKLQPLEAEVVSRFQNHGVYDRLRYFSVLSVNSLPRALQRAMRAETERSLVLAAIALKRYGLRHGGPPESLSALVPEFLPSVPVDYMDGKSVKFHRLPEGNFVLYSVGEDGTDDGGDAGLRSGKTSVRMLWERKDVVWPDPASAEELKTYRIESAKN